MPIALREQPKGIDETRIHEILESRAVEMFEMVKAELARVVAQLRAIERLRKKR